MNTVERQKRFWWAVADRAGPWLAAVCALHCLALPIALALNASIAVSLLSWRHPYHGVATFVLSLGRWETLGVGLSLALSFASLALGFMRHRHWQPAAWLLASTVVFMIALSSLLPIGLWEHAALMASGSLLLLGATLHDRRLRKHC